MENLWKHLATMLLFIITVAIISAITQLVLKSCDSDEWKKNRNQWRLYHPIDLRKEDPDDDDHYYINSQ